MGSIDHLIVPVALCYVLMNIPPMLWEIYAYYLRGGLVMHDIHFDDTWHPYYQAHTDWWVWFKRYVDRPNTEAAKAYYAYLDWSAGAWDKSVYIHRRLMAKGAGEYNKWRIWIYGPFRFGWRNAHNKQWMRGDDAAGYKMPMWGDGGEERAREEYQAAKDKGYDEYWHYHRLYKQMKREGTLPKNTQK